MTTLICVCGEALDIPAGSTAGGVHCPHCNAGPIEVHYLDAPRCAETDGGYQCELNRGHARHHIFFKPEGVVLDARHLAEPHELFKLSLLRGK